MQRGLRVVATVCVLLSMSAHVFAGGASDTQSVTQERMVIDWIGWPHVLKEAVPEDGNYAELLIEERFNVDIRPVPLNISDGPKFLLYFAEGNSADVFPTANHAMFRQFLEQKLFRPIEKAWLYQYMPDWMERVSSFFGKKMMEDSMTYEGKTWGVPFMNYSAKEPYYAVARQDWMDAVGISNVPETLDEFEEMIKRFTINDPDGNGQDDTYGIHDFGLRFPSIFGAFGIQRSSFYERDGVIVDSYTMEEYRQVLEILARWYARGYMDPEVVTDNRTIERNKWSEGLVGCVHDHRWWMCPSTPSDILSMVTAKNPEARFALLPAPIGPEGKSGSFVGYPGEETYMGHQGSLFFGVRTSDAKVKRIMEIKNTIIADHSLFVQLNYGEEGVHWDKVNGVITTKPRDVINNERRCADGLGQFYAVSPMTLEDIADFIRPDERIFYDHAATIPPVYRNVTFPLAGGKNEAWYEHGGDIDTIWVEYYWNVITGNANLTTDWDAYVAKIRKAGLDRVVVEYQRLYEEATK